MIIYKITNLLTTKVYIGQTVQPLKRRINQHKCKKYAKDGKSVISQSIQKHGFENFKVDIIYRATNLVELDYYEEYMIDKYNCISPNGYNLKTGGQQGRLTQDIIDIIASKNRGMKRTPEVKKILSEAHKGLTYPTNRKPVKSKCLKTGKVTHYDKLMDVSKDGFNWSATRRCANKERKQYKGHLWAYKGQHFRKGVVLNTWLKHTIGENLTTGETIYFHHPEELREMGFRPGNVSQVCSGQKLTHKGWRFRRPGQSFYMK